MVTPEEEPLILKQFLRFGETRAIVGRMSPQHLRSSVPHSLAGEDSVSSICCFRGNGPATAGGHSDRSAVCGASPRPLLSSPVLHFVPSTKVGTGLRPRLKQVWFGSSVHGGGSFRRSFPSGPRGSICMGVRTFTTHLHLPPPPVPRQQGRRGGSLVAFVAKASMTKVGWRLPSVLSLLRKADQSGYWSHPNTTRASSL